LKLATISLAAAALTASAVAIAGPSVPLGSPLGISLGSALGAVLGAPLGGVVALGFVPSDLNIAMLVLTAASLGAGITIVRRKQKR
jgi:hypothetical protein